MHRIPLTPEASELWRLLQTNGEKRGRAEGFAEGLARGLGKGEKYGLAEGLAEGKRESLQIILTGRDLSLTAAQRACIQDCSDIPQLDAWLAHAITAATTAAVLGAGAAAVEAGTPRRRSAPRRSTRGSQMEEWHSSLNTRSPARRLRPVSSRERQLRAAPFTRAEPMACSRGTTCPDRVPKIPAIDSLRLTLESGGERRGRAAGLTKGFVRGFAAGLTQGVADGIVEGRRESLLMVLAERRLPLTAAQRARVAGCSNVVKLDTWLRDALTARKAAEALGPAPTRRSARHAPSGDARHPRRSGRKAKNGTHAG